MKENIIDTRKIGIGEKLKNLFEKIANSEWLAPDMLEDEEVKLPPELLAVRAKWDGKEKTLGNRGETNPKEISLMRENIKVQKEPQIKKAKVEKVIQEEKDEFIKE